MHHVDSTSEPVPTNALHYQAENYRRAGKAAERAGKVAALGSVFEGVVSAAESIL